MGDHSLLMTRMLVASRRTSRDGTSTRALLGNQADMDCHDVEIILGALKRITNDFSARVSPLPARKLQKGALAHMTQVYARQLTRNASDHW